VEIRDAAALELEEDSEDQRGNARRQRVAWLVMVLVLLAALVGLFGSGPCSRASAQAGSLRLQYERFVRHGAQNRLSFEVDSSGRDELRLWLGRDLLARLQVQSVMPTPISTGLDRDGVTFVFRVAQPGRSQSIQFLTQAQHIGRLSGRAELDGGGVLEFTQLVYP
jgi:hypothetical protein